MTDRVDMEAVIEAVLFVSNDPVSRDKLLEVFSEEERLEAQSAIDSVVERYRESSLRGILIDEVAGGLRLVSRPDLHGYLRRFFEVSGTNKLSMAALETLAVIAYRQPVTGPEIQELRGVNSSGVVKKLLERRLVRIAGRKEVVGKPFLYATTRDFLMHFGLRNLKELPPLEQFEELLGMEADTSSGQQEVDLEEEIGQQAAALDEADDDAHADDEAAAIEAERRAAEELEGVAGSVVAGDDEPTDDPQPMAEESDDDHASDVDDADDGDGDDTEDEPTELPREDSEPVPSEGPGADDRTTGPAHQVSEPGADEPGSPATAEDDDHD